ncbi:Ig-like domain-containing protein [Mycolicibacterium parafortuitum]|nr:Ig-like domain-containing protein [Mycolicibacterium parafortuitum]
MEEDPEVNDDSAAAAEDDAEAAAEDEGEIVDEVVLEINDEPNQLPAEEGIDSPSAPNEDAYSPTFGDSTRTVVRQSPTKPSKPQIDPELEAPAETGAPDPEPTTAQSVSRSVTSTARHATSATPAEAPSGTPAPAPLVQQPQTPVGLILGGPAAFLDIAAKALDMLFNPSPSVPGDPPLLLGVLAFVRREIQRTFFNTSPEAIADVATTYEGVPARITVLGNDVDPNIGDVLTITDYTQAVNGVVSLNADGSFAYTPKAGFSGTDMFTYTVSDEASAWHSHGLVSALRGHTSTTTVSVTVVAAPANESPSATDDSTTTTEDTSVVIDVKANDTDPDEDTLVLTATTAPQHGTVAVLDGKVTYTPTANYHGTDTFTYTVSDGEAADTATVTVTITPVNDAPVAVNDSVIVPGNSGATAINVLGNDTDVDTADSLTVTVLSIPTKGGTATINADKTIAYTPATGFSGTETFTYTVSDGTATAVGTVSVIVTPVIPVNIPPVAVNDSYTMPTGATSATVNVVSNDTDPDGDTLTVSDVTGATHGTTTFTGGTITYTPTPGYAGTETLTYTITDGKATDTATLTITVPAVSPVNQAPVVGQPAYEYTTHAGSGIISGTVDVTDEDGDPLAYTVSGLPDAEIGALAIDPATGVWQFKPTNQARFDAWRNPGEVIASFSLTVSDGLASVTVNIEASIAPAFDFDYDRPGTDVDDAKSVVVLGSDGSLYLDNADGLTVVNPDGSPGASILLGFRPTDAALGKDGRLYLTDPLTDSIAVLNPETGTVSPFASSPSASGLAFDSDGRLFVTSLEDRTITIIDLDGSAADVIQLDAIPTDVAVGADGTIYVAEIADDRNSVRLTIRNADGSVAAVLYDEISAPLGSYAGRLGLAIGPNGGIYLADSNQGTLTAFTPDGQWVSDAWNEHLTRAFAVHPDGRITVLSSTPSTLIVLTPYASQFDWNYDYTVDQETGAVSGEVYVLNPGGHLTFELTSPPSSALGTLTLDPATGSWVFVPTAEAVAAATYGTYDPSFEFESFVDFVITASDGTQIEASAPIVAADGYTVDVIEEVGGAPTALAVGSDGRIYVVNHGSNSITVVSAGGQIVDSIELNFRPVGIASSPFGFLVVTNGVDNTLTLINHAYGNAISSLPLAAVTGGLGAVATGYAGIVVVASEETDTVAVLSSFTNPVLSIDVPNPTGVAVGADDEIYIVGTDDEGAGYLRVYDVDGNLVTFTLLGGAPSGIAFGPNGKLYVSDQSGVPRDVAIVFPDGWVDHTLELGVHGSGITVAPDGRVYIADTETGTLTVLTPPDAPPVTTPVGAVSTFDAKEVTNLYGIAVTPDGRIMVTGFDAELKPILGALEANGTVTKLSDVSGMPVGIEVGPDGRIHVTDFQTGTVTAYDPAAGYAAEIVATIPGATGLAFDDAGNLYVTGNDVTTSGTPSAGLLHIISPDGSTETVALPGLSYDVQVAPDGRVFVTYLLLPTGATAQGGGGVLVLNSDGTITDLELPPGTTPAGVAIGPDGTLFITSPPLSPGSGGGTLVVRYPNGITRAVELGRQPFGLDFDNEGRLLITDLLSHTITVLNPIYDPVNEHAPAVSDDPDSHSTSSSGVVSGAVIGADADGDLLTYSVFSDADPTVGAVVVNPLTGGWQFTPTAQAQLDAWEMRNNDPNGDQLSVTFSIGVTDGQLSDAVAITVNILPGTQPAAQDPAFTIIETNPRSGFVTGRINVVDADGDILTYQLENGSDSLYVYLRYDTGEWQFWPSAELRNAASGTPGDDEYAFVVNVTDGATTVPVTVTVPVFANSAPIAADPAFTITSTTDSTGRVEGLLNVTDDDGDPLTYSIGWLDSSIGTIEVDYHSGAWVFTPTAQARYNAWADAAAATASFSIRATDSWASTDVTVVVDIVPGLEPSVLQQLAANGDVLVSENEDGTVRAIHGPFVPKTVSNAADAAEVFKYVATLLGSYADFAIADAISTQQVIGADDLTTEHFYRLRPKVDGITALSSSVTLVVRGDGIVTGLFSSYAAGLNDIDSTPSADLATPESAVAVAKEHLRSQISSSAEEEVIEAFLNSVSFEAILAVYDLEPQSSPRLVWKVTATSQLTAVDADTEYIPADGEEIIVIPSVNTTYFVNANGADVGVILDEFSSVGSATVTTETAKDLFGIVRTFNASQSGSTLSLVDASKNLTIYILTYRQETLPGGAKVLYQSYKLASRENGSWNPEAVSAHYSLTQVYNFYRDKVQHKGIDGAGTVEIPVYVNGKDDSSYWNGSWFEFSGKMLTARAVDVVAHEYTHAVIQYIILDKDSQGVGLGYQGESGALNEAYSDILGSLIEGKSRTDPGRWLIREDSRKTIRDLSDPSRPEYAVPGLGNPRHDYSDRYLLGPGEKYSEGNDWGGVHVNSTIMGHAFYRMIMDPSEGSWRGSGRTTNVTDKEWAQVFYNSLYRLPSSATFVDARSAIISSAKVKGFTEREIQAIQDAFDHVGVYATSYKYGSYESIDLGSAPYDLAFGAENGRAYVAMGDGTLKIVDTAELSASGHAGYTPISINLGGTPGGIAVASDGWLALVTNPSKNEVAVVDTKVIETIPVDSPGTIAVSSNGLIAFVTNTQRDVMTVVDLTTGINPATVEIPLCAGCNYQGDVALNADGTLGFITHPSSNTVSVIRYNGINHLPEVRTVAIASPYSIASSADGSVAVVYSSTGRVSVIDASGPEPTVTVVPEYFSSYTSTGFIALSADGKRAFVTNHSGSNSVVAIDTSDPVNPRVLWRNSLNDLPHSVATTSAGTRAYVVAHDHFWVLDTRSGRVKAIAANMPSEITYNSASDYQQVAVRGNGNVVIATSVNGDFVVLNGSAF